ncbi:MAG: hypothetical protein ABSG73_13440 [Candidatus Aminicenantales bacterium]|jgi:hypothetical protein
MERSLFYIGERPCAVWDLEIRKKNLQLLRSFDTHYFEYLANTHSAELDSEHAHQAAMALRTSYGLALETFFSLLGATIQAPDCVFGWLFRYQQEDLRVIIQGIKGTKKLCTRFRGQLTWDSLSRVIHRNLVLPDKAKEAEIRASFAKFWEYLASDYSDPGSRSEFNSIKHSLRIQPGGFRVAIGLQEKPDVPAPPERMQRIAGSKFGATTLILEPIIKKGLDYRVREYSQNWNLTSLVSLIRIISMSINNVISSLLILNGQDPEKLQFFWPEDLADFDRAWENECVLRACSRNANIGEADIRPTKAEDVEKFFTVKEENPAKK